MIYATGQGSAADPPASTGVAASASPLSEVRDLSVMVGGVPAPVAWAGLTPGSVGLLQININIPEDTAPGEQRLRIAIGGFDTASKIWIE